MRVCTVTLCTLLCLLVLPKRAYCCTGTIQGGAEVPAEGSHQVRVQYRRISVQYPSESQSKQSSIIAIIVNLSSNPSIYFLVAFYLQHLDAIALLELTYAWRHNTPQWYRPFEHKDSPDSWRGHSCGGIYGCRCFLRLYASREFARELWNE